MHVLPDQKPAPMHRNEGPELAKPSANQLDRDFGVIVTADGVN